MEEIDDREKTQCIQVVNDHHREQAIWAWGGGGGSGGVTNNPSLFHQVSGLILKQE